MTDDPMPRHPDLDLPAPDVSLLPCPFCGSVAVIEKRKYHDDPFFVSYVDHVSCGNKDCRASAGGSIEAWNSRTPTIQLAADLPEAKGDEYTTDEPMPEEALLWRNQYHRGEWLMSGVTYSSEKPMTRYVRATALTALQAQLAAAEARAEKAEGALERIDQWSQAYPLGVFPEPDMGKVRAALEAAGLSLDAVAASNMRHVVEGVGNIARAALPDAKGGE